ncbi:unnamed protein product [Moneuplotes crassus]|uniref:Uncharacterized protein n=1 Tax=Euplotes crassus TaxID=5936 RepID=A0AAD1Y8G6_EUPCR|nr:unnamed protein product [Moneuplotes crassus]
MKLQGSQNVYGSISTMINSRQRRNKALEKRNHTNDSAKTIKNRRIMKDAHKNLCNKIICMTERSKADTKLPPVERFTTTIFSDEDSKSDIADLDESLDEFKVEPQQPLSKFNRFASVEILPNLENKIVESSPLTKEKVWPNCDKYQEIFGSNLKNTTKFLKKGLKKPQGKKEEVWPVYKPKRKKLAQTTKLLAPVQSKRFVIPKSPQINLDGVSSKFYKDVEHKDEKKERVQRLMKKWKNIVIRIKHAIKLIKHARGDCSISFTKDVMKDKFFTFCEKVLQKIEKGFQDGDMEFMHQNIIKIVGACLKVPDATIIKSCYYALACYADHYKEYKMALFAYGKLRSAAEGVLDYKMMYKSFIKRASIYVKLKEYKYSLRMFKLILKYAWMEKNIEWEFEAYKGMAICYYYQGLLEKSNFYYKRYIRGKNEPIDSNLRIYALKRYTNEYRMDQVNLRKDRTEYSNNLVHKIRDSTIDYSFACDFIEGVQNSQISKRSVYMKLETPVETLRDKDLPSPSIGNNNKGNLFVRMRKAKKILSNMKGEQGIIRGKRKKKEKEDCISGSDSGSCSESSELPLSEVEKLIDGKSGEKSKNILLFDDEEDSDEIAVTKLKASKAYYNKSKKRNPMSIDYLKMQQNEREDHNKIIKMRMAAFENRFSPFSVASNHKDSGKSKTNIILSHLGQIDFDNPIGRNDRKKAERILKHLRNYIQGQIEKSFIIKEDRIREITQTSTLYYFSL